MLQFIKFVHGTNLANKLFMRIYNTLVFILIIVATGYSQQQAANAISTMKWGADFNIHITFDNDSTTIYDVRGFITHRP
jgi:hypothetical protein